MITRNLNIALFPMDVEWGDKNRNLTVLSSAFEIIHPDTDLLVIPETFSTGFPVGHNGDVSKVLPLAESTDGATVKLLQELAASKGIAIIGSLIVNENGLLFNRAVFIEPCGEVTFADKRHLFSIAGEDRIFTPGDSRMLIRYRGWNIAVTICYDLRFPIWTRNVNNSYDLLINIAEWPSSRIEAWKSLLTARAIENLSYVAGVDCKGTDPQGVQYGGESRIIDFMGRVIPTEEPNPHFAYASLSMEKLISFRNKFPAWKDADSFRINI